MSDKLKIVLAQLNLHVGDISGNLEKHLRAAMTARDELAADVIVFPELSLTGYPPEDLLLRPAFIAAAEVALKKFTAEIKDIYCVIGHPLRTSEGLFNACSLVYNGNILGQYAKQYLPNYSVFDEYRYFVPGHAPCVVPIKGIQTGLVICEDLWFREPIQAAANQGARLILSPNASPFEVNKHDLRVATLASRAKDNHLPIIYVNTIGGQDEIVFDGGSMVINADGQLCQCAGFFTETLLPVTIEFNQSTTSIATIPVTLPTPHEKIYQALVLGVRDYIHKNGFPGAIIGVSGGIDSALTLAIAVDAIGKEKVHAVTMPSRYTADISNIDAAEIANNLGVKLDTISIEPAYNSFLAALAPVFAGKKADVTEENIQARCRAILLMALSNKSGYIVLTTGNRSEIATGYCTLYGDMAGGFAVLKDIPKMLVYALAKYRNSISQAIPERTLTRPPTAELAPDQKDEDSLPPYSILDKILEGYLNDNLSIDDLVANGFDRAVVTRVVKLLYRNEYKRKQSALGTRINLKSFGKDWRYPVTHGFKG